MPWLTTTSRRHRRLISLDKSGIICHRGGGDGRRQTKGNAEKSGCELHVGGFLNEFVGWVEECAGDEKVVKAVGMFYRLFKIRLRDIGAILL